MAFGISMDDIKNTKRFSCIITAFGVFQFFILTSIAALFFPGGYDYFNQYFSELGQTEVSFGILSIEPNPIGNVLFLITTAIIGVCLVPFWLVTRTIFTTNSKGKIITLVGTLSGLLASPFIVGAGVFPIDTEGALHVFVSQYNFLATAFAIFFYSIAMLLHQDYSTLFAGLGFIIFIMILIFVFVPLGTWNPLVQKIIFYSYAGWILIQLTHIWPLVGSS